MECHQRLFDLINSSGCVIRDGTLKGVEGYSPMAVHRLYPIWNIVLQCVRCLCFGVAIELEVQGQNILPVRVEAKHIQTSLALMDGRVLHGPMT